MTEARPELDPIVMPYVEVRQPIGTFYLGVLEAASLVAISSADVRRIADREVETYTGIQRPLDPGRVAEIGQYVQTSDATFPTAIILAIRSEDVELDDAARHMRIQNRPNVASILDGQHRIAGLATAKFQFDSPVVVFLDMDLEEQALTFATINLTQTKVNRSLAFDLYDFAKTRSPQKTCHQVARLLNSEDGSPFLRRIKLLGVATPGIKSETITQALVVDRLLELITANPMADRDALRRGKRISWSTSDEVQRPLRRFFVEERDELIARNLWNFFSAVQDRWPDAWNVGGPGLILNRTTGFTALMRLFRRAYVAHRRGRDVVPQSEFFSILQQLSLTDGDFNREKYPPGSTGFNRLATDLAAAVP